MANHQITFPVVTRSELIALLNEDLAGEFKSIMSYVIYSQVLRSPQYMTIAAEFEKHVTEELAHALMIAEQIDNLGGMPLTVAKSVKTSIRAEDMLHFDLHNENETIARYQQRVRQCEALGEYAVSEQIREILVQEQGHQIALANALGAKIPNDQESIETLVEFPRVERKKIETVNRSHILANALGTEVANTSSGPAAQHASNIGSM